MKIRNALQRLLEVGQKPHYYNFGYLPTDQWTLRDRISGKCFGKRNLVKRLQMPALLKALSLKPTDTVLDYGCGSGYITVEIAKIAGRVHGVDITPELRNIPIPPTLKDRLSFHVVSSVEVPFPDEYFDCILASELLGTIQTPGLFLPIPSSRWFKGESIDFVRRTLLGTQARIYQYLDRPAVTGLVQDLLEGRQNRRLLIWSLLNFEWWLNIFYS